MAVLQNRQDSDCPTFIIDKIRKYHGTVEFCLMGQHTKNAEYPDSTNLTFVYFN